MVLQHYESPLNAIRNEIAKILPRYFWRREGHRFVSENCYVSPSLNKVVTLHYITLHISQREISFLLFEHSKATQKQIAEKLGVQISNESFAREFKSRRQVFAISIRTQQLVRVFRSENEAKTKLFLDYRAKEVNAIDYCIRKNLVFNLNKQYVVLSRTRSRQMNNPYPPCINHCLNLTRLRGFLYYDLGYRFVNRFTSKNEIAEKFEFLPHVDLKGIMEHFFLPWGKRTGHYFYKDPVYVHIVSPRNVSIRMTMKRVGQELTINHSNIRDYIDRQVFFEYDTPNVKNSFLIYAE